MENLYVDVRSHFSISCFIVATHCYTCILESNCIVSIIPKNLISSVHHQQLVHPYRLSTNCDKWTMRNSSSTKLFIRGRSIPMASRQKRQAQRQIVSWFISSLFTFKEKSLQLLDMLYWVVLHACWLLPKLEQIWICLEDILSTQ